MIGLTWAFFVAGCPTTVASQWKVESCSTAQLMLAFYRYLAVHRLGPATALQRAEIEMLHSRRYSHPFYWASFVVMGSGYNHLE